MGYRKPTDGDTPSELPGRWDDEPYDPQAKQQYQLQRALSGQEDEYQKDLEKILKREEDQLAINKFEGDMLGLEDGRAGLSLGVGADGLTLFGGYNIQIAIWSIVIVVLLLIGALFVRGCYGTEADLAQPAPVPAGSSAGSQSPGS